MDEATAKSEAKQYKRYIVVVALYILYNVQAEWASGATHTWTSRERGAYIGAAMEDWITN